MFKMLPHLRKLACGSVARGEGVLTGREAVDCARIAHTLGPEISRGNGFTTWFLEAGCHTTQLIVVQCYNDKKMQALPGVCTLTGLELIGGWLTRSHSMAT